jgi:hypothetical protein
MPTTTTYTITEVELVEAGFSQEEIHKLEALRTGFDAFRESCESNQQYERLRFLKYLYEHGLVPPE